MSTNSNRNSDSYREANSNREATPNPNRLEAVKSVSAASFVKDFSHRTSNTAGLSFADVKAPLGVPDVIAPIMRGAGAGEASDREVSSSRSLLDIGSKRSRFPPPEESYNMRLDATGLSTKHDPTPFCLHHTPFPLSLTLAPVPSHWPWQPHIPNPASTPIRELHHRRGSSFRTWWHPFGQGLSSGHCRRAPGRGAREGARGRQ